MYDIIIKLIERKIKMNVENLKERLDELGSFANLAELRDLKNTASEEIKKSELWKWLEGFIDGRSVNEELGGVEKDLKESVIDLHSCAYKDLLELKERALKGDSEARERLLDLHENLNSAVKLL